MDLIETNLSVLIPEKHKKYGWTNNIKALTAFEYLHDKKLAIYFMSKDNNTYFYMLKRSINKGYTKVFKEWFQMTSWNQEHSGAIKSLFWRAIHKNAYYIAKYLYDKHSDKLDFSLNEAIMLMYNSKDDKSMKFIYNNFVKDNPTFQRIPFSVWCSIHDMSYFSNDKVMAFCVNVNNPFKGLFDLESETEENKKPLSLKEALAIFGYRYEPRNRMN